VDAPSRSSARSARSHSRGARLAAAIAFVAIAGGFVALGAVGAARPDVLARFREDGPSTCPFKLATGLRCPLCGMTRATVRMARGDFAGALHLHPLAPLVLLAVLAIALVWLAYFALDRPVPPSLRVRARFAVPLFALVWAVNLLFGTG